MVMMRAWIGAAALLVACGGDDFEAAPASASDGGQDAAATGGASGIVEGGTEPDETSDAAADVERDAADAAEPDGGTAGAGGWDGVGCATDYGDYVYTCERVVEWQQGGVVEPPLEVRKSCVLFEGRLWHIFGRLDVELPSQREGSFFGDCEPHEDPVYECSLGSKFCETRGTPPTNPVCYDPCDDYESSP